MMNICKIECGNGTVLVYFTFLSPQKQAKKYWFKLFTLYFYIIDVFTNCFVA